MRQIMVRYKVKPERVQENEELVRAVYDELRRTDEAPVVTGIEAIGSYGLVGAG